MCGRHTQAPFRLYASAYVSVCVVHVCKRVRKRVRKRACECMDVCAHTRVFVCASVQVRRARVRVRVRVCVCVCVCVVGVRDGKGEA